MSCWMPHPPLSSAVQVCSNTPTMSWQLWTWCFWGVLLVFFCHCFGRGFQHHSATCSFWGLLRSPASANTLRVRLGPLLQRILDCRAYGTWEVFTPAGQCPSVASSPKRVPGALCETGLSPWKKWFAIMAFPSSIASFLEKQGVKNCGDQSCFR